jgi:hypothetical protein
MLRIYTKMEEKIGALNETPTLHSAPSAQLRQRVENKSAGELALGRVQVNMRFSGFFARGACGKKPRQNAELNLVPYTH